MVQNVNGAVLPLPLLIIEAKRLSAKTYLVKGKIGFYARYWKKASKNSEALCAPKRRINL